MKKFVLPAAMAFALLSAPAVAADLKGRIVTKAPVVVAPPPWDIAFGASLASDYIFRGITQSNHKPSVSAYFEPRYNSSANLQWYAGIAGSSISFPNRAAAEIDLYGGVRPTFGPLALDLGFIYYWYPGGQCFNNNPPFFGADCTANADPVTAGLPVNGNVTKKNASFFEVYGKAAYTIGDFVFGANLYYSPDIVNTGATGTWLSGTLKWTAPSSVPLPSGVGFYASGEFGRQWLGTSDNFYGAGVAFLAPQFAAGVPYADYNTWNIGIGWTYKVFTLDLRYTDTSLSKADCNAFTSDHTATFTGDFSAINPGGFGSNWCGARFFAKLSADLTANTHLK